jgi:allantoicase
MTVETALVDILTQIGLEIDAPNAAGNEPDVVQVVEAMNETGKDLAARFEWSKLFATTTVGAVSQATLPNDFGKLVDSLPVRRGGTGFRPLKRASSPDAWALLSVSPSTTQGHYYLSGGVINFAPVLTADGAVIQYQSKNWCETADEITQNGDALHIPERLIVSGAVWRWRRQKGFPFDDFMAEHEAQIVEELENDRGTQ